VHAVGADDELTRFGHDSIDAFGDAGDGCRDGRVEGREQVVAGDQHADGRRQLRPAAPRAAADREAVDRRADAPQLLGHAEAFERIDRLGPHGEDRADVGQVAALLDERHVESLGVERGREGEAGDAAADDADASRTGHARKGTTEIVMPLLL